MVNEKSFYFSNWLSWQIEPTEKFIYILNHKTNKWYSLDGISKDIWLLIEPKKNLNDINEIISKKYEVKTDEVCEDISDFIEELYNEDLIIVN